MKSRILEKIYNQDVKAFLLTDSKIEVEIMTLGATILSIKVPDKNGEFIDVALGYKTPTEYLNNEGYVGATIGRVANRIANGEFTLNGQKYSLYKNDNTCTLHGGKVGFDKKIWKEIIDGDTLILSTISEDLEEGFPGELDVKVRFSVVDGGLKIDYEAISNADTIVNLTNHAYFNLSGESSGDVLDTSLFIDGEFITPVDQNLIPTKEYLKIINTPFDFTSFKPIGKEIDYKNEQLEFGGGYDINYVLNGKALRKVATAVSPKSGVKMDVITDQMGLQFYSGNMMKNYLGKSGTKYKKRYGFCLETQSFPNAINCTNFPNVILRKGEVYKTTTIYKFSV